MSSTETRVLLARLAIEPSLARMTLRPPHWPITTASLYVTSSSLASPSPRLSRRSRNSSVASPKRPLILYTTLMGSPSPASVSQTFCYTSFTGRSSEMILLFTSSSMPLSSSSRATSSQSVQIFFLTSLMRGPRPGSLLL